MESGVLMMRVALPIWNDRVSPVMDAATRLLIVDYSDQGEVSRTEAPLGGDHVPHLARLLSGLGIQSLICGGISHHLFSLLEAQRIKVIPWVTGPVEEVLEAYTANQLWSRRFLMPGCSGRGRGRGRGRGQGLGHGRGGHRQNSLPRDTNLNQEIAE
jgi:predicted Fe-Mo cluster-binding NifX family protein